MPLLHLFSQLVDVFRLKTPTTVSLYQKDECDGLDEEFAGRKDHHKPHQW